MGVKVDLSLFEHALSVNANISISDQATGSTYSLLVPYWSSKLDKSLMKVKQVSERTGVATVENTATVEGYVTVTASGVKVMEGKILVPGSIKVDHER